MGFACILKANSISITIYDKYFTKKQSFLNWHKKLTIVFQFYTLIFVERAIQYKS